VCCDGHFTTLVSIMILVGVAGAGDVINYCTLSTKQLPEGGGVLWQLYVDCHTGNIHRAIHTQCLWQHFAS